MFYPFSPLSIKKHENYHHLSFMKGPFSLSPLILSPLFEFANSIELTLSKLTNRKNLFLNRCEHICKMLTNQFLSNIYELFKIIKAEESVIIRNQMFPPKT